MTSRAGRSSSPAAAGEALLDADGRYLWVDPRGSELLGARHDELTGRPSFAAVPADANEVWWVEDHDAPPTMICQLTRQENEWKLQMHGESERPQRSVEFAEALVGVAGETDLEAFVRRITVLFEQRTGLLGCTIVLMDIETGEPTFAGGDTPRRGQLAAMEECRRNGAPMTIWQGLSENRVVIDRHWSETVMTDERFAPIRPYLHSPDADVLPDAFAAIPLRLGGTTLGVIAGAMTDSSSVDAESIRLWTDLAFEVTLALQYSAAIRDARARGGERERQRLNEELHDNVSQDLFALKLLAARAAEDAATTTAPSVVDEVQEIRQLTETIEANVRSMIGGRRRIRSSASLTERLAVLGREIGSHSGVHVHIDVSHTWNDLSDDSADDVVRIVHEALRNIVKHARATTASIRLVADPSDPETLVVEIVDDGVAFDPDGAPLDSFGLASIRERVAEQGGSVEIRTVPSKTLRVRMQPQFASEWDAAQHDL